MGEPNHPKRKLLTYAYVTTATGIDLITWKYSPPFCKCDSGVASEPVQRIDKALFSLQSFGFLFTIQFIPPCLYKIVNKPKHHWQSNSRVKNALLRFSTLHLCFTYTHHVRLRNDKLRIVVGIVGRRSLSDQNKNERHDLLGIWRRKTRKLINVITLLQEAFSFHELVCGSLRFAFYLRTL